MSPGRCECTEVSSGLLCQRRAAWFVAVGSRKLDGQYSCPQHLDHTCRLLYEADAPAKSELTITAVKR